MADKKRYRLLNSTRKTNPQNAREKVGFLVGVRYVSGGVKHEKTLVPRESVITEELNEAHLKQMKAGNLEITEFKDINVMLKEHTKANKKKTTKKKTTKKKTSKKTPSKKKPGKAMSMDDASKASKKDFEKLNQNDEGAVNPNGKDNFTAVAKPLAGNKVNDEQFTATPDSVADVE